MKQNNSVFPVILGVAVGLAVVLLISIFGGVGISGGRIPETLTTGIGWTAVAAGSTLAAVITGFGVKEKKLLWTLCSGGMIFLILLIVHGVAFRGQVYAMTGSAIAAILPACVVGIFATQWRPKRKY